MEELKEMQPEAVESPNNNNESSITDNAPETQAQEAVETTPAETPETVNEHAEPTRLHQQLPKHLPTTQKMLPTTKRKTPSKKRPPSRKNPWWTTATAPAKSWWKT